MTDKSKVVSILRGKNLTAEQRMRFNGEMSPEKLIEILKNGGHGLEILISRREDPDDNVAVEYVKVEP
ncbi:hypothetical protein A3A38_01310 [Candidatus Kaiserbacteria bacterium RIFCSPLOWO2_01_FULL_53_17]|uniref:Uncharacterized protein n=1 Tax=Candidatus Kaiserbacteria bacterium RIFCSPLOWO2_01_FULL_53_17 TaxID=1798511 RepID=A0A1F6EJ13_9BACT|nr:MAG: hypothetical protein A3A38_01310 [Candidatus Kaiserbacteria bacterium RIFCSPLOWO2_01_FULL_53_17]